MVEISNSTSFCYLLISLAGNNKWPFWFVYSEVCVLIAILLLSKNSGIVVQSEKRDAQKHKIFHRLVKESGC